MDGVLLVCVLKLGLLIRLVGLSLSVSLVCIRNMLYGFYCAIVKYRLGFCDYGCMKDL